MGSIVKSLFGGGKTKQTEVASTVPIKYEPLRGFRSDVGTKKKFALRTGGTWTAPSSSIPLYNETRQSQQQSRARIGGMISDLKSNQNPFIEARVRPFQQALDSRVADTTRAFAQRGVFGSLSENEISKTRFLGEQAIGDERAKATDEALGKLFDAEASLRGINQDEIGLAETQMKDELLRLGLSLDAWNAAMGNRKQLTQVAGGTTTTQQPIDILGGIAAGLGIVKTAKSLSDRRLKRDIEKTNRSLAGLPMYTFRYLWGEQLYHGVMADEVEKLYPEAVSYYGGIALVDYAKLGVH